MMAFRLHFKMMVQKNYKRTVVFFFVLSFTISIVLYGHSFLIHFHKLKKLFRFKWYQEYAYPCFRARATGSPICVISDVILGEN